MTRKTRTVVAGAAALSVLAVAVATAAIANVKPYAVGIVSGYETKPLLSVGDTVPEASNPSKTYQMVGIPDGLGAHKDGNRVTLYMNHELGQSSQSEPVLGEPLNRGAIVSRVILSKDGSVLRAERAYDTVYLGETLVGPAAAVGNATPAFARFCSGSLAGKDEGFDRWIYFANEESGDASTFDGKGGLSVAVIDDKAYGLPDLGHFAWEQTMAQPQPRNSKQVVLVGMEDGPSDMEASKSNSQVYMYVGQRQTGPGTSVLRRNGLVGGKLYVLAPSDPATSDELAFTSGRIGVRWVEIPNAGSLDAAQLEAEADAAGAFRFARPEDAAWNDENRNQLVFVTTGESRFGGAVVAGNKLGRIYELSFDRSNVTKPGKLRIAVNADAVVAAGGDTALSPDNIDVSDDYLMVNEDGTTTSRAVMAAKGRDGSIWRFAIDDDGVKGSSAKRVVELDPPGRDGVAVGAGVWETSGIIDADDLLGDNSWLFVVQAHPPTAAPGSNTVEDGQLLLLTTRRGDKDENDKDKSR